MSCFFMREEALEVRLRSTETQPTQLLQRCMGGLTALIKSTAQPRPLSRA